MYQLLLPSYDGELHDEIVLGESNAFTTRGSFLIAFNIANGKEMWRWDARTPGIKVFAALANGGCLLQTPAALVEADNATDAKELFKGQAMIDGRGRLCRKQWTTPSLQD